VLDKIKISRALLSVHDKTGLLDLARELDQRRIEIISTGGTAQFLKDNGFAVISVSDVTRFPEILGGRVKTLHPNIHGAILARREQEEQMQQLAALGIAPIDLVVVNLYPFEKTIARPGCSREEALENIDIGGPCMIGAAARRRWRISISADPA